MSQESLFRLINVYVPLLFMLPSLLVDFLCADGLYIP